MPASPEYAENLASSVVALYQDAERIMLERVAHALAKDMDAPDWAERKLLQLQLLQAQTARQLQHLTGRSAEEIAAAVVKAHNRGTALAEADLNRLVKGALGASSLPPGLPAVEALVTEAVSNVIGTHGQILRSVSDVYRTTIAETAPQVLLGTQTRREAAQSALDRFAAKGIGGFVDKSGRRWAMESYVEMATRAATANAAIDGHAQRLVAGGQDLVIVSDAPQECKLCLIPGTVVEGPVPTGRTRSEYTGDVIRIVTASGKDLTGTPDHPVLTPRGWFALKDLHPGDQVISDDGQQRYSGVVPDDVQVPTLIEKAGEAFAPLLLSGPTRRDFDQGVSYREVRAVPAHGDLLGEGLAAFGQPLSDLSLVGAVRAGSGISGLGNPGLGLGAPLDSAVCLMCRVEERRALVGSGLGPASLHHSSSLGSQLDRIHGVQSGLQSVVTGSGFDSRPSQVVSDGPSADSEGGADLLRSLAGHVAADEIVSLSVSQFSGHVWDLTTEPSWFVANGIVTHNCRPWEGQVLSLSGVARVDGVRPAGTLAQARAAGFQHPGCRHSIGIYIPGVTTAPSRTADPQGDADRQKLRYLERQTRAAKRRSAVALDDTAKRAADQRVRAYQSKIRAHVDTTSAKRQPVRERLGAL